MTDGWLGSLASQQQYFRKQAHRFVGSEHQLGVSVTAMVAWRGWWVLVADVTEVKWRRIVHDV